MGNIQTVGNSQILQVTTIKSTTEIVKTQVQQPPKQASKPDQLTLSTPRSIIKHIAGDGLIYTSATIAAEATLKHLAERKVVSPSALGIGTGLALGLGAGLSKIQTDDPNLEMAKNTVSGALVGGALGSIASAALLSMASETLKGGSVFGIVTGMTLGAGIGLMRSQD
jgi:ABC-type cobalamin transport system permease subunit